MTFGDQAAVMPPRHEAAAEPDEGRARLVVKYRPAIARNSRRAVVDETATSSATYH
jgi:hypothetical protein